ncbi:glycosyltransferase family 2 protein [Micromonospora sp. NPDC049645]|uniref:glycosyltransferase family 2 protein n=1 Tax=Micromonospora sp. NPDC049645 TaxID=3155508 RepID=UPI003443482B
MTVEVSVIIPTRDRPSTLRWALRSVADQDVDGVELLVANDGRTDVSSIAAEFGARVVPHEPGRGPSAARNAAIEQARGRYTAFLDDDDLYLDGHLRAALDRLESGADLVYTSAVVAPRRVRPGAIDLTGFPVAFDLPLRPEFLGVTNFIAASAVACRDVRAIGARFDEDLRVEEDWDMWQRLVIGHGYRIAHLNRPAVVYHRIADVPSATTAVLGDVEVHRMFFDAYRTITTRWPVRAGSPAARYRDWMRYVYRLVFDRLESGRPPHLHWYERCLRVLFDAFTGAAPEARLPGALAEAVDAEGPGSRYGHQSQEGQPQR